MKTIMQYAHAADVTLYPDIVCRLTIEVFDRSQREPIPKRSAVFSIIRTSIIKDLLAAIANRICVTASALVPDPGKTTVSPYSVHSRVAVIFSKPELTYTREHQACERQQASRLS